MEAKTPWFEILIEYHNHKGGVNNLQTAKVKNMKGTVLKVFSSTKKRAKEYANQFIKKETLKAISNQKN